jgi:Mitochondrial pyruvate carriers
MSSASCSVRVERGKVDLQNVLILSVEHCSRRKSSQFQDPAFHRSSCLTILILTIAATFYAQSGAAIYDASQSGPEVISLFMTPVLIVYSTLFARWAWIVQPRNMLLCGCHVTNVIAQSNQLRRALEYKLEQGQHDEVQEMGKQAAVGGAIVLGSVLLGPTVQRKLVDANLGVISTVAGADAGPFTLHFWAPMSKWFISGASFFEFNRPTDKISLPQYTALTLTGMFFTRYALLVTPVNYTLCSVNVALFVSSLWHLTRKIKADYIDK